MRFGRLALLPLTCLIPIALSGGCSASGDSGGAGGSGGGGGSSASGGSGGGNFNCNNCLTGSFLPCDAQGNPLEPRDCAAENKVCVAGRGCLDCAPGSNTCVDNTVTECTDEGVPGNAIETCDPGQGLRCIEGECTTECDKVAGSPSNVGCEFWAVDLPNERVRTLGPQSAAEGPWGVILANAGTTQATVTVERNLAAFGDPVQLEVVTTEMIPVGGVLPIGLPQAELVGPTVSEPPGPPGSQLTSNAFRITTTAPVIAYQFNNFTNAFSNDASLLLPRSGLGTLHRVLGFTPSKPVMVPGFSIPGVPEHAFVTVVGVEPNTTVRIKAGGAVNTDTVNVPNMEPGDEVEFTIGPFDVVNIASRGAPGDLTGTVVSSNNKVAVFSSTETSQLPRPNTPPDGDDCCTDHIEEQIFPVTAMGTQFVVTRSPPRGTSDVEEDLVRFLGIAEPATVTTNLPGADASFTLQPGELREVWTKKDFVAETTAPVAIGQILVSQQTTEDYKGDPSLTIFPPIEQYRRDYAFLIPPTWPENFVVISTTQNNTIQIDGAPTSGCETVAIGPLAGSDYVAIRCPLGEGVHRIAGVDPFGITVYGYSGPGSFAFAGGADVKPVYEPPPIF